MHMLFRVIDAIKQPGSALLKIKVLHDAIEEHFCLNGSIKNL